MTGVMPADGGFSVRHLPLARCEQSPIALRRNVSLDAPRLALWKWQPETVLSFLTTDATVDVTTSDTLCTGRTIRRVGAIVTVDLCGKPFVQQELECSIRDSPVPHRPPVRLICFAPGLTTLTIVLNIPAVRPAGISAATSQARSVERMTDWRWANALGIHPQRERRHSRRNRDAAIV